MRGQRMPDHVASQIQQGRTGSSCGLITCSVCENMCDIAPKSDGAQDANCPRCGGPLHLRKKNGLSKSAAYLVAAYILYIPANLLPVMQTESIFGLQDDTIMSGVLLLMATGSWPLALLVFLASIVIPLLKLFSMSVLILGSLRKSNKHQLQRAQLFRIIEIIGRWSMLDVYVVTVLVALVQFQNLVSVSPGGGAFAFAAVVVLTLLSAQNFDSRSIWDTTENHHA